MAGLASGDAEAATTFVRRFQSRIYGLALTITRDSGLAEEIAQEAFVRAWRRADSFDARRGRVDTWLLTITRNLAIDVVRLRGIGPVDVEIVASELGSTAPFDHRRLEPDERERLRLAVAALPDSQRRALLLAVYGGRTAREISQLDGVALGTVKTRIRLAMIKLRETLEVE